MGEEKTLWVRIPILTAFLPVRIGILTHNLDHSSLAEPPPAR